MYMCQAVTCLFLHHSVPELASQWRQRHFLRDETTRSSRERGGVRWCACTDMTCLRRLQNRQLLVSLKWWLIQMTKFLDQESFEVSRESCRSMRAWESTSPISVFMMCEPDLITRQFIAEDSKLDAEGRSLSPEALRRRAELLTKGLDTLNYFL